MDSSLTKKLPKANGELPKLVAKNFLFLSDWTSQNEEQFTEVMEALAKQSPAKYADVYVKCLQILSAQSKLPARVQVQHTMADGDIEALRNLAEERKKHRKYDEYEEV